MYKFLSCTLCLILLTACKSTSNIKNDYKLRANSSSGVLIASIEYVGKYSGYSVRLSDMPYTKSWSIQFGDGMALIPIPPKGDFSEYGSKGELFAIELKPGDYQIDGWNVFSGYATISPLSPISIKFRIEPGKATYIGNFTFTQTDSLGLTVTGVSVSYSNKYERDKDVLTEKYPFLTVDEVMLGVSPEILIKGLGEDGNTSFDIPIMLIP